MDIGDAWSFDARGNYQIGWLRDAFAALIARLYVSFLARGHQSVFDEPAVSEPIVRCYLGASNADRQPNPLRVLIQPTTYSGVLCKTAGTSSSTHSGSMAGDEKTEPVEPTMGRIPS